MQATHIPSAVWQSAGVDPIDVMRVGMVPFHNGMGAASGRVELITAELRGGVMLQLIRKTFEPLRSGKLAESSRSPDRWAYWRCELIAYQSGVLPNDPGLRAPRLFSIVDDVLYIEYVGQQQPATEEAALDLGR